MRHSVGLLGTGAYVPEKVLRNADLEKLVDTSDEWIRSRTGIRERRIALPEQAVSDLALPAAEEALQRAGLAADKLDLILVATVTPDMSFPSTANVLQHRLGAVRAAAFDMAAACSGFLYALSVAAQFVANGTYRYVLVIGAETLSKITDYTDRNTCVLFGDGAGAAVVGRVREGSGFLSFALGSDGGGGDYLSLPAGGSRLPATLETVRNGQHFLQMSGNEVFKFAVRVMEQTSLKVVQEAGLALEDVDFLVPHQANIRIIDAAKRRLGLSDEQVVVNLNRYGNMSSASIPVALHEAVMEERIGQGDNVVLVGFGAGLTWGGSVIRWDVKETG